MTFIHPLKLVPVALTLLNFACSAAQIPIITQTNTTVRVMSANLNGNTQSYQPFALRILQGLKPDVVCIQEFNYNNNTAADFRSMVDQCFGTNFVYYREPYTANGNIPNGVISRYPILHSGSWADSQQSQPNRGYAWAQLDVPGTNDLYVVSVHLLTSSAGVRASEAANLKTLIQANFPANAWVVLAGDFNTATRTESCMATLKTFLSDYPIPTDAVVSGNSNTSETRTKPHDYVMPSFSLTNLMTASVFPSHSFSNGLVFDSRVYTPLSDVTPILSGDSSNAQHLAVMKDFKIPYFITNFITLPQPVLAFPSSNTIRWQGLTNVSYSVQSSTNLSSSNWVTVGTVSSTTTNFAFTNVSSGSVQKYFRVSYP